jgi:hypothetical protein
MPLPTKEEIALLEGELGFPFRTAHFTDEDGEGVYRHDIMPSDLVRSLGQPRDVLDELYKLCTPDSVYVDRNNQAEDRYYE